jgi:hypothetical protein
MLSVCTRDEPRPPSEGTSSSSNTVRSCIVDQWHEGHEVLLGNSAESELLMMAAMRLACFDPAEFRDVDTSTRLWR